MARDIVGAYGRLLGYKFNAPVKNCPWLEIRESIFSDRPRLRWESRALVYVPMADICISAPALADAIWGEGSNVILREQCELRAWNLKTFLSGMDALFPDVCVIFKKNSFLDQEIRDASEACVLEKIINEAALVSGNDILKDFAREMRNFLDDAAGISYDCQLLAAMDIDPEKNVFCLTISCLKESAENVPLWNWTADGAFVGNMDIEWELKCFARAYLANPRPLKKGWRIIG